eukprot:3436775-Pyramimonas_sp.AAC.1
MYLSPTMRTCLDIKYCTSDSTRATPASHWVLLTSARSSGGRFNGAKQSSVRSCHTNTPPGEPLPAKLGVRAHPSK